MDVNTKVTITMTHGQHLALIMAVLGGNEAPHTRTMLYELLSKQLPQESDKVD